MAELIIWMQFMWSQVYTFEEIFGNDIENIANSYMFVPISKVENNN